MLAIVCIDSVNLMRSTEIAAQVAMLAGFLRRHEAVLVCPDATPGMAPASDQPHARLLLDGLNQRLAAHTIIATLIAVPPDQSTMSHLRGLLAEGGTPIVVTEPRSLESCALQLHEHLAADATFSVTHQATLRLMRSAHHTVTATGSAEASSVVPSLGLDPTCTGRRP